MIKETIKRSTIGAHRIFTERTKITCGHLIREQIIKTVRENAIGSEITAINQGDIFTIHSILNRIALYKS